MFFLEDKTIRATLDRESFDEKLDLWQAKRKTKGE